MAVPYLEELYVGGNQLTKCPDASCCKKVNKESIGINLLWTYIPMVNIWVDKKGSSKFFSLYVCFAL